LVEAVELERLAERHFGVAERDGHVFGISRRVVRDIERQRLEVSDVDDDPELVTGRDERRLVLD